MHRLLARQFKKLGLHAHTPPDASQWAILLDKISEAYQQADNDRYTLERSLQISSDEMQEMFQRQKATTEGRLQALVNALKEGRLHHAYLFTGTRGVGKTTVAALAILWFALTRDGEDWKCPSTMSPGAQSVSTGFVHCSHTAHAARFAGTAGSSGPVGTSSGNWRAPAMYDSSGNGAR